MTVNGRRIEGAWYFEYSSYYKGYPIEGHWRPERYWPAHSSVHVDIPAKGVSAGKGLTYNDSLTLDFSIGAKNIGDRRTTPRTDHVNSDGKKRFTFPVSLGATNTPTRARHQGHHGEVPTSACTTPTAATTSADIK